MKRGKNHGWTGTATYRAWNNMKSRCNNPNFPDYDKYGGRGISVCERWNSFVNFLEDMGERPAGMSLDRFPDGGGNYEPSNCRWATVAQQLENRCNTIFLTIDGVTKSYVEWEKDSGLPRRLIYNRLIAGWDPKDAVTRPKGNYAKSGLYLNYKGKGPRVQQI